MSLLTPQATQAPQAQPEGGYDKEGKGALWSSKKVSGKYEGNIVLDGRELKCLAHLVTPTSQTGSTMQLLGLLVIGTALENYEILPEIVSEILVPNPDWNAKYIGSGSLPGGKKICLYLNENYTEGSKQPMVKLSVYQKKG